MVRSPLIALDSCHMNHLLLKHMLYSLVYLGFFIVYGSHFHCTELGRLQVWNLLIAFCSLKET